MPFLIVLKISFSEVLIAVMPYAPLWGWVDDTYVQLTSIWKITGCCGKTACIGDPMSTA